MLFRSLQGGFKQGSIIEMISSSKGVLNTWCYQLSTLMRGRAKRNVLWIDTSRYFMNNYADISIQAARFGYDFNDIFFSIVIEQIWDGSKVLSRLSEVLEPSSKDYGLIILNTLPIYKWEEVKDQFIELFTELRSFTKSEGTTFLFTDIIPNTTDPYGQFSDYSIHAETRDTFSRFSDYSIHLRHNRGFHFVFDMMEGVDTSPFDMELSHGFEGCYPNISALEQDMWRLSDVRENLREEGFL